MSFKQERTTATWLYYNLKYVISYCAVIKRNFSVYWMVLNYSIVFWQLILKEHCFFLQCFAGNDTQIEYQCCQTYYAPRKTNSECLIRHWNKGKPKRTVHAKLGCTRLWSITVTFNWVGTSFQMLMFPCAHIDVHMKCIQWSKRVSLFKDGVLKAALLKFFKRYFNHV